MGLLKVMRILGKIPTRPEFGVQLTNSGGVKITGAGVEITGDGERSSTASVRRRSTEGGISDSIVVVVVGTVSTIEGFGFIGIDCDDRVSRIGSGCGTDKSDCIAGAISA